MTDKERLEEIKEEVESLRGDMSVYSIETETSADIILDDMEWLIEQAKKNITCQEVLDLQKDALKGLLEQNKRYREVIQEVLEEEEQNLEGYESNVYKILLKALEESE